MQQVELLSATVLVGLQASWLALGAFENVRIPRVNATLVSDVLSLQGLQDEDPETYSMVEKNRVTNPRLIRVLFIAIVTTEVVVASILLIATFALVLAVFGAANPTGALTLAKLGVTGFTAIWGSFLVGGQWFYYWASHESVQTTHFLMTIWGVTTLAVLLLIG